MAHLVNTTKKSDRGLVLIAINTSELDFRSKVLQDAREDVLVGLLDGRASRDGRNRVLGSHCECVWKVDWLFAWKAKTFGVFGVKLIGLCGCRIGEEKKNWK